MLHPPVRTSLLSLRVEKALAASGQKEYPPILMSNSNPAELPEWLRQPLVKPPTSSAAEALRTRAALATGIEQTPQPPKPVIRLQMFMAQGRKILGKAPLDKTSALMWLKRVRAAVVDIYGPESTLSKSIGSEITDATKSGTSVIKLQKQITEVETLVANLVALANSPISCPASQVSRPPSTRNVFIIHGHDELNTRRLSDMLQTQFQLVPVIMLSKPGMSRPLTDKFEDEAQTCVFAFALFTPDDEIQNQAGPYSQARPNVIYEAGWFVGRLGKQRVAILLKNDTAIHSDLHGVSQIRFADNVEEKFLQIKQELQAANIID
jgi:predicted nucleotide-binding protein